MATSKGWKLPSPGDQLEMKTRYKVRKNIDLVGIQMLQEWVNWLMMLLLLLVRMVQKVQLNQKPHARKIDIHKKCGGKIIIGGFNKCTMLLLTINGLNSQLNFSNLVRCTFSKKNPGVSNGALLFSSCLRRGQFTDLSCKPKPLGSN